MAREKILVVNHDLDSLSRIYLALVHRKFNTEACNNAEEIPGRLKRFKPAVIVLDQREYNTISEKLKIPAIVLIEPGHSIVSPMNDGDIQLKNPIHIEELIKAVERLV